MFKTCVVLCSVAFSMTILSSGVGRAQSLGLPSIETQNAIKRLTIEPTRRREQNIPLSEFKIDKNNFACGFGRAPKAG